METRIVLPMLNIGTIVKRIDMDSRSSRHNQISISQITDIKTCEHSNKGSLSHQALCTKADVCKGTVLFNDEKQAICLSYGKHSCIIEIVEDFFNEKDFKI